MKRFYALPALTFAVLLITAAFTEKHNLSKEAEIQATLSEKTIKGSPVVFHQVVQLETENEVLPVNSDVKGLAILRITADRILHSKVIIQKLEDDDGMLTAAHIHTGAEGVAGPVLVGLVNGEHEFGTNKKILLTAAQYNAIINGSQPLYVNAHSTVYPAGIVRGQIR